MPNRIIKESICYSESVRGLSWFEEVLFYRLIVNADDYGRLDGRSEILQSRLFPLRRDITDKTLDKALSALTTAGMVRPYTVEQKPYLQLTAWESHQQVRAQKSKYPPPPENDINGNQMISDVPVIQSNPNPIRESEPVHADAPTCQKFGTFGWVRLTQEEYDRLVSEHGQSIADYYIRYVDESAEQTGNKNKWKNWNLTVRKAIRGKWGGDPAASGVVWRTLK